MKKIFNSQELKNIALDTIERMATPVKATLGPGGNPIILQRTGNAPDGTPMGPLITKDGVTVAEYVSFTDAAQDTIARAILQVAKNTVNQAGDGTTTAIVLAEAIYKAGYKHIEQGKNSIQLYAELQAIKDQVVEQIDQVKQAITLDDVYRVALISSNGDHEISQIVSDAIMAVGEDGHIALEEGTSRETELVKIEGAVYKQGYTSFGALGANLITDRARNVCEMLEPAVLLYAGVLDDVQSLAQIVMKILDFDTKTGTVNNNVPVLIIANDITDPVREFVLQNRVHQGLNIAVIKSPFDGSPNSRTEMLEDLACMLGAKVAAKGILDLKNVTLDHIGSARKIEIKAQETIIYEGAGDEEVILNRVEDLKKLQTTIQHEWDRENVRIRIGKLTGGIAIVRVGGDSDLEILEKKDRIEDALCAARVAIQDGIVPGGGYTLYKISQTLDESTIANQIMKQALQAPIRQIITNVGKDPNVVLSHMDDGEGYNARTLQYADLMAEGVIDPSKVTKSALQNAVSIAGLLLTTGGAIVIDKEKNPVIPNPLHGLL